jgi:hypothetical protein
VLSRVVEALKKKILPKVDAASQIESQTTEKVESGDENGDTEESKKKKKKEKVGFRDRKVCNFFCLVLIDSYYIIPCLVVQTADHGV